MVPAHRISNFSCRRIRRLAQVYQLSINNRRIPLESFPILDWITAFMTNFCVVGRLMISSGMPTLSAFFPWYTSQWMMKYFSGELLHNTNKFSKFLWLILVVLSNRIQPGSTRNTALIKTQVKSRDKSSIGGRLQLIDRVAELMAFVTNI